MPVALSIVSAQLKTDVSFISSIRQVIRKQCLQEFSFDNRKVLDASRFKMLKKSLNSWKNS